METGTPTGVGRHCGGRPTALDFAPSRGADAEKGITWRGASCALGWLLARSFRHGARGKRMGAAGESPDGRTKPVLAPQPVRIQPVFHRGGAIVSFPALRFGASARNPPA